MSTNTYPVFFQSLLLDSSSGEIYTVPASPTTITLQDLKVKLTNTTAATRLVTVYAVPSGSAESNANAVLRLMSVPPYDYIMAAVPRLGAGGQIRALSDVTGSVSISAIGGKLHTP